jgi:phosphonate transport system substrate-binding protein
MMPYTFTVSPDFTPEHISGWFIFNTWLQKTFQENIHLELYDNFADQRAAVRADKVDLIYSNPYDASLLVREKGFAPLARPDGKSDEAIIAVNASHNAQSVEDLKRGISVATTDDPDIHMMGMIMLEPADLHKDNIKLINCENYVLVAKALIRKESDVGIFFAEAYLDLSNLIRKQLRPLVSSQIQVVHHALLAAPRLAHRCDEMRQVLSNMNNDLTGQGVLESLGFKSWEPINQEEMEFMIDIIDTLID